MGKIRARHAHRLSSPLSAPEIAEIVGAGSHGDDAHDAHRLNNRFNPWRGKNEFRLKENSDYTVNTGH